MKKRKVMRKLLSSWKTYVLVIAVGFIIWAVAGVLQEPVREGLIMNKSLKTPYAMIEPKTIYEEVKDWAKVVGQLLAGAGGVGGTVRLIVELFRKKKKGDR